MLLLSNVFDADASDSLGSRRCFPKQLLHK